MNSAIPSEVRPTANLSFRRRRFLGWLELASWICGIGLLGFCVATGFRMYVSRHAAELILPGPAQKRGASEAQSPEPSSAWAVAGSSRPQVVGRVEIPAIGLVTPLLAGDDAMSLSEGAGHIPGTAYPGGLGTVGIAGHRDTHFRKLRQAATGMDVRLIDRSGTYHYRVTSSEIVTPDKVSVLDIQATPGLVLITCYPFSYIGKAPKRFVVHAELLSVTPDEPAN